MEIADIILLIVQRFFIERQKNKEEIVRQITHTLAQLNQKQNIELHLHPSDIDLLHQSEFNINLKPYKNMRIIPDETLLLGGCIIRSEHGVFNASIERQIDNLKHALLKIKNNDLLNS
jgi:flagellar assembly protein FliH